MVFQKDDKQLLFPIVQGNFYADLRVKALENVKKKATVGFSIGGLSVGEPKDKMYDMLDALAPNYPDDKVRYFFQ